ncbi:integrase catalytic domain-containing protein [Trichonephila clavipes]|nr:integrase catalytic domain-containing protein [Trichonephila clavipes]
MIKLPDHTLAEFLTNESIEWNVIPPRSPNHGGLWEAGVKAFKFHLKRVVGNAHLTLEEFITILCEIEAVLNSRPLTPLTSNFDDFETLTPGHFLVGRPLTSIVEAQITNINENQLSRWERLIRNDMLHSAISQSQLGQDFTQSYSSIILNHFANSCWGDFKNLASRSLSYYSFTHPVCLIEKSGTISLHVVCSLQMRTHSLPIKMESWLALLKETNFVRVLPFQYHSETPGNFHYLPEK